MLKFSSEGLGYVGGQAEGSGSLGHLDAAALRRAGRGMGLGLRL